MVFDYAGLRDGTVEALIANFGATAQIAVNDPGTGDPWDSQIDSETLHDVTVVRTGFKHEHNRGTLVEQNDLMFLMSTEGVTVDPALANRLIIDSKTYQIVRVDPLKPGSVTMKWDVHVRK